MHHCQPLSEELQTYTSFQSLSADWDAFLPAGHPLKTRELRALELSKPNDVRFAYITLSRHQKLLGLISLQVVEIKAEDIQSNVWKSAFLSHLKDFIFCKPRFLLVCGNAFRSDSPGFYFEKKEDEVLVFDALKAFDAKNPFKINFAGWMVKDSLVDLEQAKAYGFKSIQQDLQMEMRLPNAWQTFDDYLAQLSKKYLQRARKIRTSLQGITVQSLDEDAVRAHEPEIERLYTNVVKQQAFHLLALPVSYFLLMKQSLEERFEMKGYFLDGKLVAFSSLIHHPDNGLEIYYIGLDYAANEKHNLYFNLLFDGLETAILQRKKLLKLGRTGFDAKASLGGLPVPGKHLIRMKRGLPSMVFQYLTNWYQSLEKPGWKSRNPLNSVPAISGKKEIQEMNLAG